VLFIHPEPLFASGLPRSAHQLVLCDLLLSALTLTKSSYPRNPCSVLQQHHWLTQEREKRLALELRQAEGALNNGEAGRQALISQHAAALEQQGQRVEALEKQLQKLQGVEKASRQEVEKLSRQLYLKRPQVIPTVWLGLACLPACCEGPGASVRKLKPFLVCSHKLHVTMHQVQVSFLVKRCVSD